MKTVAIRLTDKQSDSTEDVTAEFEDEEIVLFEDYIANTDRLLLTSIVKDGLPPGTLKLKYDKEKGTSIEVNLPSEDSIFAFLHCLRRFILHDERSSYNTITGIIGRRFDNKAVRSMIKSQRKVYEGKDIQNTILIQSNDTLINSEKMLFDWLNAFEYHNDATKRAEIEKLHQLMPLEASRAIFLMLLIEKVKAIVAISDFINLISGKIKTLEARA